MSELRKTRGVKRAAFVHPIEVQGVPGAHNYMATDTRKVQLSLDGPFLMVAPKGYAARHVPLANVKYFEFEEE